MSEMWKIGINACKTRITFSCVVSTVKIETKTGYKLIKYYNFNYSKKKYYSHGRKDKRNL